MSVSEIVTNGNMLINRGSVRYVAISLYIVAALCLLIVFQNISSSCNVDKSTIMALSWVGLAETIIILIVWGKISHSYFNLFSVFLLFVAVFNFGQCFLWAFNIEITSSIINGLLYREIECSYQDIALGQVLYMIAILAIACGGICGWSPKNRRNASKSTSRTRESTVSDLHRSLFRASVVASFFSIPITLVNAVLTFIFGQVYSYHDLYYGSISDTLSNPILSIGSALFFPSLLGLLVGSRYSTKVRKFVYCVFALYAGISLLSGDRGEWIQPLIIFIWADMAFYKTRKTKDIILGLVFCFVFLFFMDAIVSLRNIGLSYEGFLEAFSFENNPIVSLLEEFGTTMSVNIIVLKDSLGAIYGDSFLMSIPTMVSTSLWNAMSGMDYVQISSWFPFEYLGLDFGTDFSIIAEPILNYGIYASLPIYFIEGMIVSKLVSRINKKANPLFVTLALISMIFIIKYSRSTFWYVLYNLFWSVIPFLLVYFVAKNVSFIVLNRSNQKKPLPAKTYR